MFEGQSHKRRYALILPYNDNYCKKKKKKSGNKLIKEGGQKYKDTNFNL